MDLVQFPRPVVVTEVRVVPLGTRVVADVPGNVRLGSVTTVCLLLFLINVLCRHKRWQTSDILATAILVFVKTRNLTWN